MLGRLLLVSLPQTHKRPATARLCRACWSVTSSKVDRADGQFVLVVWRSNEAIGPTRLVAMIRSAYRTVRLTTAYKTTKGTAKAVPFLFFSPVQYRRTNCRLPLSLREAKRRGNLLVGNTNSYNCAGDCHAFGSQ